MDDVVFIAHSMENDGYAYTDALKMLRKKKFSDDYEPHPWVTGMKAITFKMSVKEKKEVTTTVKIGTLPKPQFHVTQSVFLSHCWDSRV